LHELSQMVNHLVKVDALQETLALG